MSVPPVDVDIAVADVDNIGKNAAVRVDIENQKCTRYQLIPIDEKNCINVRVQILTFPIWDLKI